MSTTPCNLAVDEYKRTLKNVHRFWNLIYGVAASASVSLIFFLLALPLGVGTASVVPGVTSVLSGAGLGVLVKLKNDAYREHRTSIDNLSADCFGAAGARSLDGNSGATPWELLEALIE